MKEQTIKITNGELKVEHIIQTIAQHLGIDDGPSYPVYDSPTLGELSIIGTAFKKAHEKAMNQLIAKEQENSKICNDEFTGKSGGDLITYGVVQQPSFIEYPQRQDGQTCKCGHSDHHHRSYETELEKGWKECTVCVCPEYRIEVDYNVSMYVGD